jgi:hypothetical protein
MTDTNDMHCPSRSMPMIGRPRRRGGDRPGGTRDTRTAPAGVDANTCRLSSFLDDVEAVA